MRSPHETDEIVDKEETKNKDVVLYRRVIGSRSTDIGPQDFRIMHPPNGRAKALPFCMGKGGIQRAFDEA